MADNNSGWKFDANDQSDGQDKPGNDIAVGNTEQTEPSPEIVKPLIKWQAPDSFSAGKSFSWYLSLLVITAVIALGSYFLTKDKITTGVIVVCGILFGVYAAKKPTLLDYQISRSGFSINSKYFAFNNFRSFAIVRHNNGISVVLTPLKRFLPYTYIYFSSKEEKKVTDTLADALPRENAHTDVVDRILRKVGF